MSTEPFVFVHTHHLFDLCLIYIFILLITCHPVPLHGTAIGGWGGVFPQTIIRLLHCCQMEREIPSRGNFRGKIPHCPHLSLQNTLWDGKWKIIRQHCVIFLALFPVKRRTLKILNEQFFIGRPRKTVPWLLLLLQDIFSYKRKDLGKHKLNTLCVCYVVLFEWQPISWGAVSLMPCALLGAKQTASFTGRERPLTWTKCSSIIDMRYIFL